MNWDSYYKDFRDSKSLVWPEVQIVRLLSKIQLKGKAKVLDLGCGEGRNIRLLCENGFDVTAFDQSIHALNIVKKLYHLDDKQLICSNVSTGMKKLNNNYYDLVICWGLMHYITKPEFILSEIKRVLKNGSRAIFSFNSKNDHRKTVDSVKNNFSQEMIENILSNAGFSIEDIGLTENNFIFANKVESFYWVLAKK
jgi:SAM-dependent methyltransferase